MVKVDYLRTLDNLSDQCAQFKRETVKEFFTASDGRQLDYPSEKWFCYAPKYSQFVSLLKDCVEAASVLDIEALRVHRDATLERIYALMDPKTITERRSFEERVKYIEDMFRQVRAYMPSAVRSLDPNESTRINEALHCYLESCFYSTVAMAVTAIEFRLLKFMKGLTPERAGELEELTLGGLISKCLGEEVYSNALPRKHHPLLRLCNEYRIFSVHAKPESITQRVASSVLNLSFEFLLDEGLTSLIKKSAPEV